MPLDTASGSDTGQDTIKKPVPRVEHRESPTYEDYIRVQRELLGEGFRDVGIFLATEETQRIGLGQELDEVGNRFEIRSAIDREICYLYERGYRIITTTAYTANGQKQDGSKRLFSRAKYQ